MNEVKRPVFLSGPKVNLVPQDKEKHLANYLLWINDQEVRNLLGQYLPLTKPQEEKFFELGDDKSIALVIELKNGTHIGSIGLNNINHHERSGMLGIVIGPKENRRQGYGFEAECLLVNYAFSELNLHRVWVRVYDFNQASWRCAEKVGFIKEGLLREEVFRQGKYVNTILGAILAHEWKGLPWER